jgi:hypothetical protein
MIEGEQYTVSRWRNKRELFLAEMVFSKEAIKANPVTSKAFEKQLGFARQKGLSDEYFYIDFLYFISEQFARLKTSHHDYKISAAYTNLVLASPGIDGIAYPSVQTKYQGQNIVLPPNVVDDKLMVEALTVQRVHKKAGRVYINNVKNCENPNECLTNIAWIDLNAEHVETFDKIRSYLDSNG